MAFEGKHEGVVPDACDDQVSGVGFNGIRIEIRSHRSEGDRHEKHQSCQR